MQRFNNWLFNRHLDDDERITLYVHKHWLLGVKVLFWPTFAFLAGWFFLYAAPIRPVLLICTLWSIGSIVWWIRNFLDYYLDAWLITDHGIIDVQWFGWFHRSSTRILYSDVQGVSYEIKGIAATFLRYGTIAVEKISTGSAVSLEKVPHPRAIEAEILKNMENYLHSKNLKDAKRVQDILANVISRELSLEDMKGKH
ncbi:MAG: PH domain-containing protein [Candidatus Peregrinibacteria bacterium]